MSGLKEKTKVDQRAQTRACKPAERKTEQAQRAQGKQPQRAAVEPTNEHKESTTAIRRKTCSGVKRASADTKQQEGASADQKRSKAQHRAQQRSAVKRVMKGANPDEKGKAQQTRQHRNAHERHNREKCGRKRNSSRDRELQAHTNKAQNKAQTMMQVQNYGSANAASANSGAELRREKQNAGVKRAQ